MSREREKEYKPLSFSTTMRNPSRIASFLNCLLHYEGQSLTNEIIDKVVIDLISKKLYIPVIVNKDTSFKTKLNSDEDFSLEEATKIKELSPQSHKEAGFDKGWPSRFDTWYKLSMEFGFVYYEINKPIVISTTGHMLVDAFNEVPINDEKIQKVFLNALVKYQTNSPFRKNANENVPLPLLLNVIQKLKNDTTESDAGICIKELPLIICSPDNDAERVYLDIKELRKKFGFTYSDEIIYEKCLQLLGAGEDKKKRFKIEQITGEAIDEFIRKMRITGIISLRGNGRFLDFNHFEIEIIKYVLENYSYCKSFSTKKEYFDYVGSIDNKIIAFTTEISADMTDVRLQTLHTWAKEHKKEEIFSELRISCGKAESKNAILRLIDKPTRFEFLTSIALVQNFEGLKVLPNYHVDDEGLPTFTASGGIADIECKDDECNPLIEVTLMTSKSQAVNEVPAITRHLQETIAKNPNKICFSILVAPSIHQDTKYMVDFSKFQYNLDILALNIEEFITCIKSKDCVKEIIM